VHSSTCCCCCPGSCILLFASSALHNSRPRLSVVSSPSFRHSDHGKDHTLKGWWNPHSYGPPPETTLHGYDYIVVGSGPGGAPLAARLGLAGYKVLVIEAGADEAPSDWNITVPYLNAKASEDSKISWKFLVCKYIVSSVRDFGAQLSRLGQPLLRPRASGTGSQVYVPAR